MSNHVIEDLRHQKMNKSKEKTGRYVYALIAAVIVGIVGLVLIGVLVEHKHNFIDRINSIITPPHTGSVNMSILEDKARAVSSKANEQDIRKAKELQKIAYCIQSLQPKQSYDSAMLIAKATHKECSEKNISISLWIALMFAESSLDPLKSSGAGAIGLCQVRYAVWREQPELIENGVQMKDKLFWADLNIKCGTTIFKKYYDESGHKVGPALWRYNSGQTKLPEGKRPYDIEYVNKIMYYQYKVNEILQQESANLHPINDPEAQADSISTIAPSAQEPKDKPVSKKQINKKEEQP